jgi:hypothetical protein
MTNNSQFEDVPRGQVSKGEYLNEWRRNLCAIHEVENASVPLPFPPKIFKSLAC